MLRQIGVVVAVACGCGRSVDPPSYPEPVPLGTIHVVPVSEAALPAPSLASRRRARFQMRQQLSDLRTVEDLLVAGRLDEATPLADRLAQHHTHGAEDHARASATSPSMTHATTIAQASHIAAQLTATCGACHQRVGAHLPITDELAPAAGDASRCSPRHRWAIGRLADGLTSAQDQPWRSGLDTFATVPLTGPGRPQHERVKAIARAALGTFPTDSLDARAAIYSKLLATCGGCHAAALERTRHGPEVL
jgi:cytochrome c553